MNWLDLSGNAEISASGIFYHDLGNPNRFRRSGRPESAFGPRGCRITRRLLTDPSKAVTQRTLASSTGLNEGHTSRIVGKLLETGLVERGGEGIRVVDADVLLDAWQEDYRFDRHHVIRGRIPAPEGDILVHSIAEALDRGCGALCSDWPPSSMAVDALRFIQSLHPVHFEAPVPGAEEGPWFPRGG